MKQSESMLVYGVTAILVVIVGFAVLFGDESEGKEPQTPEVPSLFGDENGDGTEPLANRENPGFGVGEERPPSLGGDEPGDPMNPVVTVVPTIAELGQTTVINTTFDGRKNREVLIQQGDTFASLVKLWAPGHTIEDVLTLNETLDPSQPLPANTTLLLPHVEDRVILDRHMARLEVEERPDERGRRGRRGPGGGTQQAANVQGRGTLRTGAQAPGNESPTNRGAPTETTSTGPRRGTTYTIQDGDSLWKIAAGIDRADRGMGIEAYIAKIKQANGMSTDTIREGKTLRLP